MFGIGDSFAFSFDEFRRLRISVPQEYLPLAAWLHTDAQPNVAALDNLAGTLKRAQHESRTWLGNGWSIDLVNDVVLLESLYNRVPRSVIPESVFWPVLQGLRDFLVETAQEPALQRPHGYPDVRKTTTEYRDPNSGKVSYLDHTYFPPGWNEEDIARAGNGAWQSPQLIVDETTGAWSGMWQSLEIAGYHDPSNDKVLTYFPVLF